MGFSAGAHLTGHLNVAWQNRTYAHIDAADSEACRADFAMMIYPWESVSQPPVRATVEQASALNVTKDTPPTMLVQAELKLTYPSDIHVMQIHVMHILSF